MVCIDAGELVGKVGGVCVMCIPQHCSTMIMVVGKDSIAMDDGSITFTRQQAVAHACTIATAIYKLAPLVWGVRRHKGNTWLVKQLGTTPAEDVQTALEKLGEEYQWEIPVTLESLRAVVAHRDAVQSRYADITHALLDALSPSHR